MEARLLRREMEEEAKRAAEQRALRERNEQKKRAEEEAKKTGDLQAGLAAYYNAMRQGEAAAVTPPKEKSTWQKFLDVIDEHQTEIALGIGVAVGVGAILLSGGLATPLVAAAWAAGAAAVAGTAVAAGTVALNVHYGREWHSNLLKNTAVAGGSALVVTGGWFLLQAGLAGAGAFCATNQAACSRGQAVLEALDTIDQLSLQAKLTYQTWRGDEENASQTALDLQMEYMDGGAPGNGLERALVGGVVANAAQYADNVLDVVGTYGMEGSQVLARYGSTKPRPAIARTR